MEYEIIENPRRRRDSKGRYLKKGRGRKRSTTKRRRRRNPALATYRVNGGRRRNSTVRNSYRPRRRKNPRGLLGGFGNMFDMAALFQMSLGGVGVKLVPGLIRSMLWSGLPTTGMTGKLVQVGTSFLLAMVTRQFVGRKAAQNVFNGAMTVTLIELMSEYVMPALGLSGYVYNNGPLSRRDMAPALRKYTYRGGGGGSRAFNGRGASSSSLMDYAS